MESIKVKVTAKHANAGIPGEADSCAIAMAVKESYFPEDHMYAEVNADGTITVLMDGEYEEDTGVTPREELYTLYPDVKQEVEISNFIEDYDETGKVDDYGECNYFDFPYNFTFFRTSNA